jgi:hypothetical protein
MSLSLLEHIFHYSFLPELWQPWDSDADLVCLFWTFCNSIAVGTNSMVDQIHDELSRFWREQKYTIPTCKHDC